MPSQKIITIIIINLLAILVFSNQIISNPKESILKDKQFTDMIKKLGYNVNFTFDQRNQFSFQKAVILNDTFFQITGLQSIDSDKILLRGKSEDGQQKVKLLVGSEYEKKENELKIPSEAQEVKFVKDKILINTGSFIEEKSGTQSLEFVYNNTSLSSAMLITDQFILVNEKGMCDKLIRIWLGSMKVQVIQFYSPFCSYNWNTWFMRDLQNGEIAFGGQLAFFILDKHSLKIKQKIQAQTDMRMRMQFRDIDSFHDKNTNTTTLRLSTAVSSYQWKKLIYKFSHQTQQYQYITFIYNPTDFKLIGTDQALSFNGNNKAYHWNKLNFLKDVSFDKRNNVDLYDRQYVLVSNQQTLFAVIFNSSNTYFLEIYNINQYFQPSLVLNISTPLIHNTQITSNDQQLFTMFQNHLQIQTIKIFSLSNQQEEIEIIPVQNHVFLTYHIFDIQTDRFIIIIKKLTASSDLSLPTQTYWIQIKKISDPASNIKEIQLTDFPLVQGGESDFKIVSNNKWGLRFILYCLQNSVAVIYNIENDVLTKQIEKENNFVTSGIFASSKYVINIDKKDKSIKVFTCDKLQLVQRIDAKLAEYWDQNDRGSYQLKDDKLFVSSQPVVYDFSRQKSAWFVGGVKIMCDYCRGIFFPKRQFVYFYSYIGVFEPYDPIKAVFDSQFPMDKEYTLFENSYLDIYRYMFIQKGPERQYDLVAMIESNIGNTNLIVWKNKEPFTEYKIYPGITQGSVFEKKLFYSQGQKYLLAFYRAIDNYNLQIRNIDNDFQVAHNLTIQRNSYNNNVGLTKDNLLVLLYYNQISITSLTNQTQPYPYNLKNIISFDSNDNLDLLFVGQNKESTPENPIYSLFVIDSSHRTLFQRNITGPITSINTVALQKNGQKLAFSYKVSETTNQLTVWDLIESKSVLETQIEGQVVKQILFLEENQVLLNIDSKISIIKLLDSKQEIDLKGYKNSFTRVREFPSATNYVVNSDGNLLAFATNNSTVDIYDRFQNQISHIRFNGNQKVVSLTFTANNTLLVINDKSVISSFTQSACPHGFDNVESFCLCLRQNADPKTCECLKNFKEQQNLTCQCTDPFILKGQDCECRQNQTQVNQTCACKENFSLKGFECLCESPFIMSQNGTCGCPSNSTKNQNLCLCNENFVESTGSCFCPEGFNFVLQGCLCPWSRFISQKECFQCSVWCQECTGDGFECSKFSWKFYFLVIGCGVVLIGLILLIVKLMRNKMKPLKEKTMLSGTSNDFSNKDLVDDSLEKTEKLI